MLKLIVNGDDFGLNQQINHAILMSFRHGILRSASIIANGNSFDSAVEIIKSNSNLDIGVHLTLVGERPILSPNKLTSLLDKDGYLPKHAMDFTRKYLTGSISLREVELEMREQIKKILDYGIKITHIDSHQHIHMLPSIHDITIELARKFNIKFIRYPKEKFQFYFFNKSKSINRIIQTIFLNRLCAHTRDKKFSGTDYFAGFFFGGMLTNSNLAALIKNLPSEGVCELMCHPGLSDVSLHGRKANYRLIEEMTALINPEIIALLVEKNINLISFNDIA